MPVPHIYVDGDDCPVKDEVFKVARRHALRVTLVANRWVFVPDGDGFEMVVVGDGLDAADDWIVEHVAAHDLVICNDIPLASRVIAKDATVINTRGRCLTDDDIGHALATRDLLKSMREAGMQTSGPRPFGPRDRSEFLQTLDREVHAARRRRAGGQPRR